LGLLLFFVVAVAMASLSCGQLARQIEVL